MIYKTPGVYIKEISTFPPSVVPVETAIPAFVGHTQQARDSDGNDLTMKPTRIESLLEYNTYFGGEYRPATYAVELDTNNNSIVEVTPLDGADAPRRFYLYGCIRHFYANGGGPCYVVSVGTYDDEDAPELGDADAVPPTGLAGGLSQLEQVDEPTLLVFPDGVSLDPLDLGAESNPDLLGSLQRQALEQCATLQDRFVIMDLQGGHPSYEGVADPVGSFRNAIGTQFLKYGAAYYPWLQTIYRPDVHFYQLRLVNDSGDSIDVTTLIDDAEINALLTSASRASNTVDAIVTGVNGIASGQNSAIAALDDTINLDQLTVTRANFANLDDQFTHRLELLRSQTAASPDDVAVVGPWFTSLLLLPRAIVLTLQTLDTSTRNDLNQALAALPEDNAQRPALENLTTEFGQTLDSLRQDQSLRQAIVELIAIENNLAADLDVSPLVAVAADYTPLNGTDWIAIEIQNELGETVILDNVANAPNNSTDFSGPNQRATALNIASALQQPLPSLTAAIVSLFEVVNFLASEAETQLFTNHPIYKAAVEQVQKTMSILPCSGAVAGIYATVDRTRGVWKAPANVSVNDVVGPAIKINDADQADLNVHYTGKSVNAIRAFTGKGTLVWGARTLAGNDNEWRYVPVRRFFNMAEESIKKATEPYVFEPNDANTWTKVRAMVENFLTLQWRAGALAGAKTQQAFYVKVGLGETMTAQDILEGRMILEIGMAVVRPAEFIILKFAHKMQVS